MMEPHKLVIGIILFSTFLFGGVYVMYGDNNRDDGLFGEYGVGQGFIATNITELSETKVIEARNISRDQKTELDEKGAEQTDFEIIDTGPIAALKRIIDYVKTIGVMVVGISKMMSVPPFIIISIMAGIGVIMTFMIIYFIWRFQPRP